MPEYKYWRIKEECSVESQKNKLSITIVSDSNSWINKYIPCFLSALQRKNYAINWIHKVEQVSCGDIVFYIGCGQMVSAEILEKNKHNLVVHESDLPRGKGWSPLTWQILEGKNEIPIVLFEAEEKVDSGSVYLKDTIKFNGTELVEELRAAQANVTFKLCLEFIDQFPNVVARAVTQQGDSSYYRRRNPKDSRLDIDKSIREQFNLLRVVDNECYPAFFELNGKEYILEISKKGN